MSKKRKKKKKKKKTLNIPIFTWDDFSLCDSKWVSDVVVMDEGFESDFAHLCCDPLGRQRRRLGRLFLHRRCKRSDRG